MPVAAIAAQITLLTCVVTTPPGPDAVFARAYKPGVVGGAFTNVPSP